MSALVFALLGGSALAAPIGPSDGETQLGLGCTPQPIAGTVGHAVAAQARETNAQLYGAAAYAERVVFPRLDQESAGGWKNRDDAGGLFALDVNTITGAAWVPSGETGAKCEPEYRYLQHRVDLHAGATAFAVKKGPVGFFYVASVTGSSYATRVGSGFLPYAYGLGAAFGGYLAPFQPRFLNHQDETRSRASDYIAGAQIDVWTLGSVRAGYVGSQGAFLQASGRLVKLFGTAAIKDFSSFAAADYLRAGLDRQLWGEGSLAEQVGATSLYVRRLRFQPARPDRSIADAATDFRTLHFQQTALGTVVDLDVAMGQAEGREFLHVGRVGLHTPAFAYVRDLESDAVVPEDLARIERAGMYIDFGATVGRVELPALPYYGVEGGGRFSAEGQVIVWMPLDEGRLLLSFAARTNTPELLDAFPYAQDAVHSTFSIRAVL